jgi:hypothetical protein
MVGAQRATLWDVDAIAVVISARESSWTVHKIIAGSRSTTWDLIRKLTYRDETAGTYRPYQGTTRTDATGTYRPTQGMTSREAAVTFRP